MPRDVTNFSSVKAFRRSLGATDISVAPALALFIIYFLFYLFFILAHQPRAVVVLWYTETLRQLRSIKRSLLSHALNTLITSLVHSRLDYCNVVSAGLPACDVQRLQSILNTAVRLVAGSIAT